MFLLHQMLFFSDSAHPHVQLCMTQFKFPERFFISIQIFYQRKCRSQNFKTFKQINKYDLTLHQN